MTDGGGVERIERRAQEERRAQGIESAREHIRNAQTILYNLEVEGNNVNVPLADIRAVEARLRRAIEQIERGNL